MARGGEWVSRLQRRFRSLSVWVTRLSHGQRVLAQPRPQRGQRRVRRGGLRDGRRQLLLLLLLVVREGGSLRRRRSPAVAAVHQQTVPRRSRRRRGGVVVPVPAVAAAQRVGGGLRVGVAVVVAPDRGCAPAARPGHNRPHRVPRAALRPARHAARHAGGVERPEGRGRRGGAATPVRSGGRGSPAAARADHHHAAIVAVQAPGRHRRRAGRGDLHRPRSTLAQQRALQPQSCGEARSRARTHAHARTARVEGQKMHNAGDMQLAPERVKSTLWFRGCVGVWRQDARVQGRVD